MASGAEPVDGGELRLRLPSRPEIPQQAGSVDAAKSAVVELNAAEGEKKEKDRRTYGRTPNGTVFTVPETHDMVSQLLFPWEPKNISDAVVVLVLGLHLLMLYLLPNSLAVPFFAVVFLFWRACYNGGIGYLLFEQSNNNTMVNWAKRSGLFENPASGKNPSPKMFKILKREMETKLPKDYVFEEAPIEYNAWLTFRRLVDLVLMSDFTSYCCFAAACGGTPVGESVAKTALRWIVGWLLVFFNLWVKLDAHRVVKDFAWFWGDFFFLIDQDLTFDGVFEMAPHPMYSIGYAGFYGISLMAASYKVLFISIVAHAAQFAFLAFVESPHIEKTYNPPAPRRRSVDGPETESDTADGLGDGIQTQVIERPPHSAFSPINSPTVAPLDPPFTRNLIGIDNVDLHRVTDVAALLLQFYLVVLAISTPASSTVRAFFVINAAVWRLWHSIGIGYILDQQSTNQRWTRHFIKHGEDAEEAWRQWKGIYHLSMTMCYCSLVLAAFKMYTLPEDWEYGMTGLRHVVGFALIALQLWTVSSIYESLGEYGWFFGDFFFQGGSKLTYNGIYRFLNNPERVIGLAGVWGLALITWSKAIFSLALLSHVTTLLFIQFVEKPHMQKRYGQDLREYSGLTNTIKRSLPAPLRQWQGNVEKSFDETMDFVEEFVESAKPKLAAGVDTIVKDTRALFHKYPARVTITRLAPDLAGFDPKDYSIEFEGTRSSAPSAADKVSKREGLDAQHLATRSLDFQPAMLEYGAPIRVRWTAPLNHRRKDWIGLYMIGDNPSKDVTRVSTQGRWIATTEGAYDSGHGEQGLLVSGKQTIQWTDDRGQPLCTGEMEFAGDKLWWTTGVFEFRYHHDGKHNVMAVSKPFEIRIPKFDEDDVELDAQGSLRPAVEQALLPVVRNCFDRDPDIAPSSVEEAFGGMVEREGKFARRVVFAVRQMFGIDFSPEVVTADGNVRNLAWRICNAKLVLAPYSMSSGAHHGRSTPTDVKYD